MLNDINMCKSKSTNATSTTMQTEEILNMISRTTSKQMRVRGNLRVEVLLKSTYQLLDRELRWKQQSRKRKWDEIREDISKKYKYDLEKVTPMEDDAEFTALLGLDDFFNSLKSVSIPNDKC